jgi:phytanoyl-CoA hydroxylase
MGGPSADQRESFEERGFVLIRGFEPATTCEAMLARAVALARAGNGHAGGALVLPEARKNPGASAPEDQTSKIFKLHRDPVFAGFARQPRLLDFVAGLLAPELDCFLSQFIFKNPTAMGQPWHQDSFYFDFDRGPQVGVWLAVTEANLENGCLHVVPGSHREPVHEHVPDARPESNIGYVEIVDHDMSASQSVLMERGDLLIFHSHLMHRSTDNRSDGIRAAMVYHYAEAGTNDRAPVSPVNDWVRVR